MANQTRQLSELLVSEGASVELVQVNAPYRPQWIGAIRGLRAIARLLPYAVNLWRAAGRVDLVHVMANSGWSWHLYAAPAIWVSWCRGRPVIINYRGGEAGPFLARSGKWVSASMRRASALVFPSGFLQQVFAGYGMKGCVVPNIIDLSRFHADAAQMRTVAAGGGHVVVARNLETLYGIDTAIRAFSILRQYRPLAQLSIAGSGPQAQALRALTAELGLSECVRFTGRLDRDQMAELYRDADLMLNASRVDNMPNSVLEALASGVPVVSTDVGGIPFIVEHERSAVLVPPDAPEEMATAMARVLADSGFSRSLRDAGLEAVRQYAWPEVKGGWLAVYREAVALAGRGGSESHANGK